MAGRKARRGGGRSTVAYVPARGGSSTTTQTLYTSQTPGTPDANDAAALTLGTKFTPDVNGNVTGVRVYRATTAPTTLIALLYTAAGTELARVTISSPATGWNTGTFASPVAVTAGSQYVAAYFTNAPYVAGSGVLPITNVRLAAAAVGSFYTYGASATFPATAGASGAGYFADPVFEHVTGAVPTFTGPGDPDPWGGFWPGPSNTGVPAGTTLTAYSGPSTISTNGTVIDSKIIPPQLIIAANNVTIQNCLIQGADNGFLILNNAFAAPPGGTNLHLIDCEIDAMNHLGNDCGIGNENFTLTRCNIHGTGDGIKVGNNVVVEDCWIHDMAYFTAEQTGNGDQTHNDCAQSLGTTSLTFTHNTMIAPPNANSALTLSTGVASDMRNILFEKNLVGGGGFTIYGGYLAGTDDVSKVSNVQFINNRFTTVRAVTSGVFGPWTSVDSPVVRTGNLWIDGPNAGLTVS